jgi:serine/threonine protein kinase
MEYMDGGSLSNRVNEKKYLNPNELISWLEPVAGALDYAHRRGIVHGGLKGTSIVFDEEGKPYLTDFSLATHSDKTSQHFVLGTPEFMAPEQWEGLPSSHLTDQFALAILSYYALTGTRPYEGQENPTTRERNFAQGPVPVHEQARRLGSLDVPEGLSSVIARGMSEKPGDRYPTTYDFALAAVASMTPVKKSRWPDVFLSYRRDVGSGWATFIAHELRRRNISVFVDTERRDNVGSFPRWLEEAISNCKVFVCLLSAKTLKSKWVYEEIRLADQYGKKMVPILQEDFRRQKVYADAETHIEALLTCQGVILLDRRNEYVSEAIARLVELIGDSVGTSANAN